MRPRGSLPEERQRRRDLVGLGGTKRSPITAPSSVAKAESARKLLSTGRPRGRAGRLRRALQSRPLPRKPPQSPPRGRLLRTRPNHPPRTGKDQTTKLTGG